MQAIRSLVLSSWLGAVLGLFPVQGQGKLIWTSDMSSNPFSFNGYDQVFLATVLPDEAVETQCVNLVKKEIAQKGELLIVKDAQTLGAMGEAKLWLHISLRKTEDENIHLFSLYATVGAQDLLNKKPFTMKVWEKEYLFEGTKELQQDIGKALQESIPLFLSQYFSTNPKGIGKPVFYLPRVGASPARKK